MAWAQAQTRAPRASTCSRSSSASSAIDAGRADRPGNRSGRPARSRPSELLRHERDALATRRAQAGDVAVPDRFADGAEPGRRRVAANARPASSATMVAAVASSPERVVCVVGHAGAGKTTALAALADAFQRDGSRRDRRRALRRRRREPRDETGMPSGTLHRLLAQARQHGGLPRGCLLVVDEAGDGRHAHPHPGSFEVERADGKALLVGDPAQLPAVGPGGLFSAIVERHGAIELHDNRRQRDELERRALAPPPRRPQRRLPRPRRRARHGSPSPPTESRRRRSLLPTGGRPPATTSPATP